MAHKYISGLWFPNGAAQEHTYLAFEAYGHAMACATALELQLGLVITKGVALNLGRKPNGRSAAEMAAFDERVSGLSLPKLIEQLRKNFVVSGELVEALEIAKRTRDFLAHNFWKVNLGLMADEDGANIIAKQCGIDSWHFMEVSSRVTHELGIDVAEFTRITTRSSLGQRNDWHAMVDKLIDS